MSISSILLLTILAQSGENALATAPRRSGQAAPAGASAKPTMKAPAIFKVLVWYDRKRPLDTFKYQAYDLRNNEYTSAVDTWVGKVRTDFPAYMVVVRDVDAKLDAGQTEKLKVGAVIRTELTIAAAMAGVSVGRPLVNQPSANGFGTYSQSRQPMTMPAPTDRSFLNAPAPSFPVPVPYPRPHP